MTWEEMNELQRLRRRDFLKLICAGLGLSGCAPRPARIPTSEPSTDSADLIHMVNYPEVDDFELLARLGVNTVLIELDSDMKSWDATYAAATRHGLRLIPLIWDSSSEQSIWRWDTSRNEWQLDLSRYPESVGAALLRFLKDRPAYLEQTFAIYSFHEPLWKPELYSPARMKVFYRQITQDIFPGGRVRVYGEDITMGWEQSDECLTGVLDYETHNVYPFVDTPQGRYRPFDVVCNCYGAPTNDRSATLQAELAALDERLRRYAAADPAPTGRRPQPIVLMQTFTDGDYTDLWNRMPSAEEMEEFATMFLHQRRCQLKGLGWYPFRLVSDNYRACLHKDRFDEAGADRWEVLRRIATRFFDR